ncbi:MAG: hypothetical protein RR549_03100 [Oscillospiraceae bacterium]
MKKNKIIIGILSLCLVVAVTAGISLAYLSDSAIKTNTFIVGSDVDIDIEEPEWPDNPPPVNPGTTMMKDPTIVAKAGDSYARMKVEIKDYATGAIITDAARVAKIMETVYYDDTYAWDATANSDVGGYVTTKIIPGNKYATGDLTTFSRINETEFELDSTRSVNTGVFYYNYINAATNNILKTTTPENRAVLFTNVVVPTDWDKDEINLIRGTEKHLNDGKSGFQIIVTAQAIQIDGFKNAEEAYTALDAAIVNP